MSADSLKMDESLNEVYNLASEKRGCVKVYKKKEDFKNIEQGDYFIYFTEKGREFVEVLNKMGKGINGLDIESIKKKESL